MVTIFFSGLSVTKSFILTGTKTQQTFFQTLPYWNVTAVTRSILLSLTKVTSEMQPVTIINGNIFRVTGHLCGEFTGHRWIPRTNGQWRGLRFDAFFDHRLNKRLRNQSWCCWFETPSWPLWRHCNVWCRHRDCRPVSVFQLINKWILCIIYIYKYIDKNDSVWCD